MLDDFIKFISHHSLPFSDGVTLLAVSGGIDSVVMLDLFKRAGFKAVIGHCNFQLRGNESDEDELFVSRLAERYEYPFFSKKFNTADYAEEHRISIQMAARELRYNWFKRVIKDNNYDFLATAHNSDDTIETFFLNLIRGTGLKGLTGIKVKHGHLIRPLLFAPRKAIEQYCNEFSLNYREDTSNAMVKYKRNKIRHQVLPLFEEINPGFRKTIIENVERFSGLSEMFSSFIHEKFAEIITKSDNQIKIDIEKLLKTGYAPTLLYEILQNHNFSNQLVKQVIDSIEGPPGKQFFSQTHRIIKDRGRFIVTPLKEEKFERYYLEKDVPVLNHPVKLKINHIEKSEDFSIPKASNIACLDSVKLIFPLLLRKWQHGDYFRPLGMQDMKKLSDFFIDEKYSLADKENTWLLLTGDQIVWIIGKRVDDRFKITDQTKLITCIELIG